MAKILSVFKELSHKSNIVSFLERKASKGFEEWSGKDRFRHS